MDMRNNDCVMCSGGLTTPVGWPQSVQNRCVIQVFF